MLDGILNLDKPHSLTSHDVVNRVRAAAGQRRVGHAGTLDPMATGVLLVCLGRATRVAEYLMASPKVYRARVRLGIATDTYDAEGMVVAEQPVKASRAAVEAALEQFRGHILQVPPMYSALKHGGQRLYKLARQGVTVEREPRPVEINKLQLTAWESPELTLEATCSPGTYVRSLAHDLGQALGCGAHLAGLVRLASGDFRLEDAVALDELTRERLPSLLLPLDAALRRYPAFHLDEEQASAVRAGRAVTGYPPEEKEILARAYGPGGAFLAVLEYRPEREVWHPRKVFGHLS
jgi:tRNA pseudouridine55 synthase